MTSTATRDIDLGRAPILSLEARNSLQFLEKVFALYEDQQVFAITRNDAVLQGTGLEVVADPAESVDKLGWGQFAHTPSFADTPAQIVFSSGTEGRPKAILLSHRNLAEVTLALNEAMQVTSDIREYIGVPVTYSFGLGRARAVSAAGGQMFLPERFDPSEIRDMLSRGEINAISAVPSLWRLVLAQPEVFRDVAHAVRWIEIGSQYMSAAEKEAMRALFPNAHILQHYGLSEASRSCFLDISAGEALESVGKPMGTSEVRIVEDDAIAIRGPQVAMGRINEDGKVIPLADADGWLITSDKGALREGWVYYLGRLDDQINVAGIKLAAETVERDINALVPAATGHFAVTGVPDPIRGEAVLLAIESAAEPLRPLIAAAAAMVLEKSAISPAQALHITEMATLPRTGTNKIQRRDIRAGWQPQDTPTAAASQPTQAAALSSDEAALSAVWQRVTGPEPVQPEQSFYELGGDSLGAVQIGLAMESARYDRAAVNATLEGQSLRQVASLMAKDRPATRSATDETPSLADQTVRNWGLALVRSIMVLSVLLSHWGQGLFGRLGIVSWTDTYLNVLNRMGTPGFAMVFGIGAGFFMLHDFDQRRVAVRKRLRTSLVLVVTGLVVLGVAKMILQELEGRPFNGYAVSRAFYSPLGYYAIALATAFVWLPFLARRRDPMGWMLLAAPVLFILWQMSHGFFGNDPYTNLMEWVRRMSSRHYSIFKMGMMTVLGMAVGYWFARHNDTSRAATQMIRGGLAGSLLCACIVIQSLGLDSVLDRSGAAFDVLPGLLFYACFAVLMLGLSLTLLARWHSLPGLVRALLRFLIVIGGLALPIYVFHGLVIPIREILVLSGMLSGPLSLLLPLGTFVAAMIYAGRRLYRMYF